MQLTDSTTRGFAFRRATASLAADLFRRPTRPNIFAVTHDELDAIAAQLRNRAGTQFSPVG